MQNTEQAPQPVPYLPTSFDHTAVSSMNRDDAYRMIYRAVRNGVLVSALIITLINAALFFAAWKLAASADKPTETQQPW